MNKFALLGKLVEWVMTGVVMVFVAPWLLYRAMAGTRVFRWPLWLGILLCISIGWQLAFSLYRFGLGLSTLGPLLYAGVVWAIANGLSNAVGKAPRQLAFLAWTPGLGQLRSWIGGKGPVFQPVTSGAAKDDETLLRGAAIVTAQHLASRVKAKYDQAALKDAFHLDVVPMPPKLEPEHFLIEGKTGAGKTQAINEMMRKVRQRNQAAIIADPAGGYLARFGQDGDTILNPFDRRTVDWSPFAEIESEYDYRRIAVAAIPSAEGPDKTWTSHAQNLLTGVLKAMYERGEHSVKRLLYYMTQAELTELGDLLADSPQASYAKPANARMMESVRSTGCEPLSRWVYLADNGTFSVRKWVRASDTERRWLFLTYTDAQMADLHHLIACWLELAIVEGLSLTESQQRRLWYVMDELDSLGKITSLRAGLTKLRKYGGVCVSGLQTIAQLRTTYGHDEAQTLLSCMSTKLILKAGDGETAKYFENEIGQQEVEREEVSEGTSQRVGEFGSSSENKSVRRSTQQAVLASQITGLDNLHGYLIVTGLPIAKIELQYVPMQDINAPYEPK